MSNDDDLDLFFAETQTTPETAEAAKAGSLPIPLPLKKSTCVAAATFSPFDAILKITFHNGESVAYDNFSIITVIQWLRANSVGGFYNSDIKGR